MNIKSVKQIACPKARSFVVLFGFIVGLIIMYMTVLRTFTDQIRRQDISYVGLRKDMFQTPKHHDCLTGANFSHICATDLHKGLTIDRSDVTPSTHWQHEQLHRCHQVESTCQSHKLSFNQTLLNVWETVRESDNIITDAKHGVLFCAIPKAACSSWRAAMAILTGRIPANNAEILHRIHSHYFLQKIGLPSPSYQRREQFMAVLEKFTTFLAVRNPLERLLSAYRDKFRTYNKWTKHFQMKYGRRIIALYRGDNMTVESFRNGHDVTFTEFLQFIMDDTLPIEDRMNPHWDTYQNLCHPCHIKYDHVIKFETMAEDNDIILQKYFGVHNTTGFFPRRNIKPIPSNTLMKQYYSTVPIQLIHKVYAHFQTDMEMFGYEFPHEIFETS